MKLPSKPAPVPVRTKPAPRVVVYDPVGEEPRKRGIQIVCIDGEPCYRIWSWDLGEGWRWARNLDYWPDDGVGHDSAHGKWHSLESVIAACVEHYQTSRVRREPRERREEKDIE